MAGSHQPEQGVTFSTPISVGGCVCAHVCFPRSVPALTEMSVLLQPTADTRTQNRYAHRTDTHTEQIRTQNRYAHTVYSMHT